MLKSPLSKTVTPSTRPTSRGPFEIRDLTQVTAGADLEVTVTEADGTERSFIQASSSVPIMQREGALKYSGGWEISRC